MADRKTRWPAIAVLITPSLEGAARDAALYQRAVASFHELAALRARMALLSCHIFSGQFLALAASRSGSRSLGLVYGIWRHNAGTYLLFTFK
jgi:hypothetical protein